MGMTMADNDRDDSTDEDSSEEKTKGLSRSTIIKIAIGVVSVLVIAGGAYFFFIPSDQPAPEETLSDEIAIDENTGLEAPNVSQDTQELQLLKMREEAVALKEENLRMKEQLMNLDKKENLNVETMPSDVDEKTPDIVEKKDDEKTIDTSTSIKPNVKKSQYSNLYSRDYAPVRETRTEPPPEPKWGDFDPLYRGK